jgi:hypothetical protein
MGGLDCSDASSGVTCRYSNLPPRGPGDQQPRRPRPRRPPPGAVIAEAFDRMVARAATPSLTAAPGGIGLTGLPTYVWLDAEPPPARATAGVPGLTVEAEARPIRYRWDFGDGTAKTTDHHGRPWTRTRPGNIDHTYERRDRYELSVEALWSARYRINGGPWQPLGFFTTADAREYPVRQIIPVLTRTRR